MPISVSSSAEKALSIKDEENVITNRKMKRGVVVNILIIPGLCLMLYRGNKKLPYREGSFHCPNGQCIRQDSMSGWTVYLDG